MWCNNSWGMNGLAMVAVTPDHGVAGAPQGPGHGCADLIVVLRCHHQCHFPHRLSPPACSVRTQDRAVSVDQVTVTAVVW